VRQKRPTAFDYRARERGFNVAALPQLGGLRYRTHLFELWDTARQAFGMEQAILRQLDAARHPANREVIHGVPYEKLQAAWIAWLQFMRRSAAGPRHQPCPELGAAERSGDGAYDASHEAGDPCPV
jgi:hypothetical protein